MKTMRRTFIGLVALLVVAAVGGWAAVGGVIDLGDLVPGEGHGPVAVITTDRGDETLELEVSWGSAADARPVKVFVEVTGIVPNQTFTPDRNPWTLTVRGYNREDAQAGLIQHDGWTRPGTCVARVNGAVVDTRSHPGVRDGRRSLGCTTVKP